MTSPSIYVYCQLGHKRTPVATLTEVNHKWVATGRRTVERFLLEEDVEAAEHGQLLLACGRCPRTRDNKKRHAQIRWDRLAETLPAVVGGGLDAISLDNLVASVHMARRAASRVEGGAA